MILVLPTPLAMVTEQVAALERAFDQMDAALTKLEAEQGDDAA